MSRCQYLGLALYVCLAPPLPRRASFVHTGFDIIGPRRTALDIITMLCQRAQAKKRANRQGFIEQSSNCIRSHSSNSGETLQYMQEHRAFIIVLGEARADARLIVW